jgi:hypothetical protein
MLALGINDPLDGLALLELEGFGDGVGEVDF